MKNLELSDAEAEALVRLLHHAIQGDHFPLSPRVQMLKSAILSEGATRARFRSAAPAESLCAAVERAIPEARLRGLRDAQSCT